MKQQWRQLAVRIDAMQLRERVFLFLAIIMCALALADTLWLSPAKVAHKQASLQFAAQGVELQRLRDELKGLAPPVDANKTVREELAAATQRLDAVNQEIEAVAPLAEGGPAIETALVQFLRRQQGLTLLSTGTILQDAPNAATAAPAPAGAASQPRLARRGLELRVSGTYGDLVRYVRTLENALPTMRWGTLQIKAAKQPPELTLQVYVVGVSQ